MRLGCIVELFKKEPRPIRCRIERNGAEFVASFGAGPIGIDFVEKDTIDVIVIKAETHDEVKAGDMIVKIAGNDMRHRNVKTVVDYITACKQKNGRVEVTFLRPAPVVFRHSSPLGMELVEKGFERNAKNYGAIPGQGLPCINIKGQASELGLVDGVEILFINGYNVSNSAIADMYTLLKKRPVQCIFAGYCYNVHAKPRARDTPAAYVPAGPPPSSSFDYAPPVYAVDPAVQLAAPAQPAASAWTEYTSPDGRKYYHNPATGETKWA